MVAAVSQIEHSVFWTQKTFWKTCIKFTLLLQNHFTYSGCVTQMDIFSVILKRPTHKIKCKSILFHPAENTHNSTNNEVLPSVSVFIAVSSFSEYLIFWRSFSQLYHSRNKRLFRFDRDWVANKYHTLYMIANNLNRYLISNYIKDMEKTIWSHVLNCFSLWNNDQSHSFNGLRAWQTTHLYDSNCNQTVWITTVIMCV